MHRTLALAVVLSFAVGAAVYGASLAGQQAAAVTIENATSHTFARLFLSPAGHNQFGIDQLRDKPLEPGASLDVGEIPCDVYDVKLVDKDERQCVVEGVELCGAHAVWEMIDEDLEECESW